MAKAVSCLKCVHFVSRRKAPRREGVSFVVCARGGLPKGELTHDSVILSGNCGQYAYISPLKRATEKVMKARRRL